MEAKGSHAVEPEKGYQSPSDEGDVYTVHNAERPGLMTRLGLTPESFQKRTLADKHNQLNKTLKSRHLNMIAIGR
jgi:yeast amino acid transporter